MRQKRNKKNAFKKSVYKLFTLFYGGDAILYLYP